MVGPTDLPAADGWLKPRALSAAEIEELVTKFAAAAKRADAAGYDARLSVCAADVFAIDGDDRILCATFLATAHNVDPTAEPSADSAGVGAAAPVEESQNRGVLPVNDGS